MSQDISQSKKPNLNQIVTSDYCGIRYDSDTTNQKNILLSCKNAEDYTTIELTLEELTDVLDIISKQKSKPVIAIHSSKPLYKSLLALGRTPEVFEDIELASYVNNGNGDHSLENQIGFFGIDQSLPSSIQVLELYQQWSAILNPSAKDLWNVENRISLILAQMETRGIKIDKQKLQDLKSSYSLEIESLTNVIRSKLNEDTLNINSPKQLSQALISNGFSLGKVGKSGSPSIKESILIDLLAKDTTGVIQNILDYRTVQKMYSTYTDSLIDKLDQNNRLHGEFNQTVAGTGRLSSANPNLQNIPIRHPKYGQDLRSVFIAKEGYSLISADYSQIELRILAHLSGDQRLLTAFNNEEDIHCVTASEVFGVPLESVTKQQRNVGKTLNFALMYQQGYVSTAKQLGISNAQAKQYHSAFFEKFVSIKPFIESTLASGRSLGYVETMYGRRAYYPDLSNQNSFARSNAERAGFNMPIQGTEADLVKMSMIAVFEKLQENKLDCDLILQIHDEIVFEVRDNHIEEATKIIKTSMELNQPLKCPLTISIHSGKNWNEAK